MLIYSCCAQAKTIDNGLMRLLITFTLLTICLTAIGQTTSTNDNSWFRIDTLIAPILDRRQKTLPEGVYGNIDTEIKYTDSIGNRVIIQNSGPRGGWGFTDVSGIRFGHRVFWTRVINEADTPLELTITFPADSFALPGPDSYMKVFLHPDGLTQESKISFNGWKATDYAGKLFQDTTSLKSLCHIPTKLQKTINPKGALLFYTVVLRHHQRGINSPRAGFVLKKRGLFYKITEFGSALIPCGQIVFKK
jgi:hypothetical protein